jgi:hypothetical protein
MVPVCGASVKGGENFLVLWKSSKKGLQCQRISRDFGREFCVEGSRVLSRFGILHKTEKTHTQQWREAHPKS